jgi:aspartate carbamoyltransferase catalytic subunit
MNLISHEELKLQIKILNQHKASGINVIQTENLEEGISEVDIIYVTRVQEERYSNKEDANRYRGLLSLNQSIYTANCEPNTVIMHPLPRDSRSDANELDTDLYENPNLAIFRQADNGVVIRMALFSLVLGIENKIEESSKPVNWKVGLNN